MEKIIRRLALLLCISCVALPGQAQMWQHLATSDYVPDARHTGQLRFEADVLAFFRDNEYSSHLTRGYSLPGIWAQPKLTYMPLAQVRMELGLHALMFNGANRYPCYVYHDIGRWKGNQYQSGAHLLPWIRVQAKFSHLNVVLGHIYGGENHRLSLPLWNAEANLSQDPEAGVQLLWDLPHLHADTWVNWQSYIFEEDSHQEAFTVGTTWHIKYGDHTFSDVTFSTPIELLFHHRGGEQDTTAMGVQTLCNASLGAQLHWRTWNSTVPHVRFTAQALACYQQAGTLWPFEWGAALHGAAAATLWSQLQVQLGAFHAPRHFASLYGNPFFSTISLSEPHHFRGNTTAYLHADFHHTFARRYTLGASVEAAQSWLGRAETLPRHQEFNFSFGIFMRACPSFLLFGRKKH